VKHRPTFRKKDYPVSEIRRYLEPGPVVLVSSAWKENTNIMTMGWHMVLEFSPSLVACCISNANHSFEMIRHSQECVINVPTTDLVNEVIGIGNCSSAQVDNFYRSIRDDRQHCFQVSFQSVERFVVESWMGRHVGSRI
jgi:flavin reductase (DIM6/NTAB) family NADH-FMN oxidoreductase RutF